VGVPNNRMVLGKHSGRRALAHRLRELGYALNAAEIDTVYHRFNELADHRKAIFDQDLISLLPEHHGRQVVLPEVVLNEGLVTTPQN
jgi:2-isopropylmalate synthase